VTPSADIPGIDPVAALATIRRAALIAIMTLDDLGSRICIIGPSNSGKSTLAVAIARARGLVPVHLDQLHHKPNSDWEPRPPAEFVALHDAALAGDAWVMDGNYSRCFPQRFARATGIILLDVPTATSLWRYARRSWFERERHGALEGGQDSVKWLMIHHILFATRQSRRRYRTMFADGGLPVIRLGTARELVRFYRAEGLER
jgi:adenylate kinase family enzyme